MKVSYPNYKKTELEWLKEIPEHWTYGGLTKFLDSIVDYRGKTPEKVEKGIFLVTARNIKNGIIDYNLSQEFVKIEDYEEIMRRGKPKIGDVLFTTEAPLGEVANIDNEDIALAQRVIKFRGLEGILDNYYLKYWILSHSFQENLRTFATGSTAAGIKASKLSSLQILIPPIKEQKEIVKFLEIENVRINETIRLKFKLIKLLEEKRNSVISEAVTQGLNPNVKMKDSGVEWIGEIPNHWGNKKIKYVLKKHNRPVRDNEDIITAFRDGQVTLRKNRREDGFTFALKEIGYQGIRKNDLVVHQMDAFAGAIGVSDSDGKASPVYTVCTPINLNEINIDYVCELIRVMSLTGYIQSLAKGIRERSTDFRWSDLGNIIAIIPPIEEQNEIMKYVFYKRTEINKMIDLLKKNVNQLKEYRQSLIYEAVTGKNDIRELVDET